jgi:hypothetical protein
MPSRSCSRTSAALFPYTLRQNFIAGFSRACLSSSIVGFFHGTIQPHLDQMQHAPISTLATPEPIKDWSLTSLKDKLIKIGAKVVSHGRYVAFQMAEVAIPRQMFREISAAHRRTAAATAISAGMRRCT